VKPVWAACMAESWFALSKGEQAEALGVAYAYLRRVVDIDMAEQGTIEAGTAHLRIDDAAA